MAMCCIRLKFRSRAALRTSSAACMLACINARISCKYDSKVLAGGLTSKAGGCSAAFGFVGEVR
eukprot:8918096-Pyramimonas_sp.AAC.1